MKVRWYFINGIVAFIITLLFGLTEPNISDVSYIFLCLIMWILFNQGDLYGEKKEVKEE